MNLDKLIVLVRENSEIYDARHPRHRNKEALAAIWRDISEKLETPHSVEVIKAKWTTLRSNFMREKKKLKIGPFGSDATPKICWRYFEPLSFLDNTLQRKKRFGNVIETDTLSLNESEEGSHHIESELLVSDTTNESAPENFIRPMENFEIVPELSSKKRKKNTSIIDNETDNMYPDLLEKVPLRCYDDDDSDLLFLRSLHPMITKMGTIENLEFRIEVMQLLKRKLQLSSINNYCSDMPSTNDSFNYPRSQGT